MSSSFVRSTIKSYFATKLPGEKLVDFTAEERALQEILDGLSITPKDDWYGIEFIGDDELPISVPATNTQGCYRETGALFLHIVTFAGIRLGSIPSDRIITNGEILQAIFRGANISGIIIESVTPISTESGATLEFEHGWQSGSFLASFYRDFNL